MINIIVHYVLFKPVCIKEMIKIVFICFSFFIVSRLDDKKKHEEWFHIALFISPEESEIFNYPTNKTIWEIDPGKVEDIEVLGRGSYATVRKSQILGAKVAVKYWEFGDKQLPPK